jgi:hypothetical protein
MYNILMVASFITHAVFYFRNLDKKLSDEN